jgi:hypothetical protein
MRLKMKLNEAYNIINHIIYVKNLDESIIGAVSTGALKTAGLVGSGIKRSIGGLEDIKRKINIKKCMKINDELKRNICMNKFNN